MTFFTSYAQNCEDVLLWRALGHIKNGFYIDVGANDTEEHSVTKAFYERGWWGINVEPLPIYHQRFVEQRPRDINLALAAGSSAAEITLYDVEGVHGWATLDPQIAQAHQAEGYTLLESKVQVVPLSEICQKHVTGTIHFLKIDVEGFEEAVLRGMDFQRWRPWILVIEATLPNSTITNHEQWEHLVVSAAYEFAYFDGLNRYYVAQEQQQLASALHLQPNVFDHFHSVHLVHAWAERDSARIEIEQGLVKVEQARAKVEQARAEVEAKQQEFNQLKFEKWQQETTLNASLAVAERAQLTWRESETARRRAEKAYDELRAYSEELIADLSQQLHTAKTNEASFAQQAQASAADALAVHNWAASLQQAVQQGQAEIAAIHASTSWRITSPLRRASSLLHRLVHQQPSLRQRALNALRSQLARMVRRVIANEGLRRVIVPSLKRIPLLDARVSQVVNRLKTAQPASPVEATADHLPPALRELPQEARTIFADLQRARQFK